MKTLIELIDALEQRGDTVCLLEFSPDKLSRTSYRVLGSEVKALSAGLIAAGLKQGQRVAMSAGVGADSLTTMLAVIYAGAVVVPIDTQMGDDGLRHVLKDSSPSFLFTTSDIAERIGRLEPGASWITALFDEPGKDGHWRKYMEKPERLNVPDINPSDQVVLFYTSGTTGAPKGVPLKHSNLVYQIKMLDQQRIAASGDNLLLALPMHHVYPFVMGLLVPLFFGACIVVPAALTGPQIMRAVREGEVTAIIGVPRFYRALYDGMQTQIKSRNTVLRTYLRMSEKLALFLYGKNCASAARLIMAPLRKKVAPGLRLMASGGSALDPELGQWLEAVGWQVVVGYGLTETSPLLSLRLPGGCPLKSIGRPVPGTEIRIDLHHQKPGSDNAKGKSGSEQGEILAKGPGVFDGYRNLHKENKDSFTRDGFFRTGDLGYLDGRGCLYVTGRISTMIVTEGGENVQPENVEAEYSKHSLITEIGLLEKDRKLVALAVPDKSAAGGLNTEKINSLVLEAIGEVSRNLPSYMRISDVRVTTRSLPRTRLGKIRRHILEKRWEEAGEKEAGQVKAGPIAFEEMSDSDRLLLENPVASRVWQWLADRYSDKRLTPDTSPQLDLGIDSMGWLNLSLDLNEAAGVELDETAIARVDTVRDLLNEVVDAATGDRETFDPVEDPGSVLDSSQRRWLPPRRKIESALFNIIYLAGGALFRLMYRIEVSGRDNVPPDEPCVLTPNHASYLDPFVLGIALGRRQLGNTCWAGATVAAFDTALKRRGSRLALVLPIEPRRGAMSGIAFASFVLRRGYNLVWFPEGMRSPDGALQEFKPGLGFVLSRLSVPVIPVSIEGTYEAWPTRRKFPRPGKIRITFGPPTDVSTLKARGKGKEDPEKIVSGLQKLMSGN
ncbi:MAG: AMP-binding protein [Verrucomicrobiota bacterium]